MSTGSIRITNVTITPVAFADPPLLNSVGVHEPFALRAIIEVATDAGLARPRRDVRGREAPGRAARSRQRHRGRRRLPHRGDLPPRPGHRGAGHDDRVRSDRAQRGDRPGVLTVRGRLPGHPGQGGGTPGRRPARRRRQGRGAVLRLPVLQVGQRIPAPSRTTGARRSTRTGSSPRPSGWSTNTGSPRSSSRAASSRPRRRSRRSGRCATPSPSTRCGSTRTRRGPPTRRSRSPASLTASSSTWRTRRRASTAWPRWRGRPRCRWPPTCASSRSPTCRPPSGRTRSR